MSRVVQSGAARRDLYNIWRYIAQDEPGHADALLDRIADKLALLAANPALGRERAELAPGLRSFTVGNYVLFYQPTPDGIRLARVLHGARDIAGMSFG